MHLQQITMLGLEATAMAAVIFGLFRARTLLGLTPLYIVMGGFQYLQATLGLRVEVLPGFWVQPASVVMFTATPVTVLLIYVKEDAIEARKLVYGLVLANFAISLFSLLIGWHVALPGSAPTNLGRQDFMTGAWIAMGGTSLLFLDVLGIILLYEFVSRFVSSLLVRIFLSLLAIMAVDNMLFTLMIQGGRPDVFQLMLSGLVGKSVAVAFYSVVCWAYLGFEKQPAATVGTGDVADVFQTLTYRQKYEQARQRMVRDALTGLYNRGYFDEACPQALAQARRSGDPVSLLLIDTDNFKNVNDQLSHADGDAVLRAIAQTISVHVRAEDIPCRYGGDEFVVLLPRADGEAARTLAERFRAGLEERWRTANPPFPWGRVTTTIGIATYPSDGAALTPEDLIRVADKRLYEGKRTGRDTVVVTAGQAAGLAAPAPASRA